MSDRIRMNDLAAQHAQVAGAVEGGVLHVLRSGRYIGGPVVDALEEAIAAWFGLPYAVSLRSGTEALTLALKALGVGPGDEVIVPGVTFFATVEAVIQTGATPVVVDVRPDRPLMDPDAAKAALSPRTAAIVPVHLYGDEAGLPDLGVPVVDDAAQALGADPPVGRGALRALSFYPTKVLGAAGDGGLVLTADPSLASAVRALGYHGMSAPNLHQRISGHIGGNHRLDAVQCAVLLGHLPALPARLARRRAIAARYDAALGGLVLPRDPGSPVPVYALRHPRRDALAAALLQDGIDTAIYYPTPVVAQPALRHLDLASTPESTRHCAQTLALPCHPGLDDAAVDRVIDAVRRAA